MHSRNMQPQLGGIFIPLLVHVHAATQSWLFILFLIYPLYSVRVQYNCILWRAMYVVSRHYQQRDSGYWYLWHVFIPSSISANISGLPTVLALVTILPIIIDNLRDDNERRTSCAFSKSGLDSCIARTESKSEPPIRVHFDGTSPYAAKTNSGPSITSKSRAIPISAPLINRAAMVIVTNIAPKQNPRPDDASQNFHLPTVQ
mmetsp:Transcript_23151/g.48233  ORF Transcript_23151/g.48233 Transcript_23151/m.48233 type:complete len:202 (-) Transcript_23151:738-1343(-)